MPKSRNPRAASQSQSQTQVLPDSQLDGSASARMPAEKDALGGILCGKLVSLYTSVRTDVWIYANAPPIVVGRHASCDIKITSEFSSNRHCRIYAVQAEDIGAEEEDPIVFCEDLSTNGTFCDGRRIGKGKQVMLSQNNLLEIRRGNYFLFFRVCSTKDRIACGDLLVPEEVDAMYQILPRVLGSGTFAQVRLAASRTTGTPLAVKIVDKTRWPGGEGARCGSDFMREITIMRAVDHPNIIRIVDVVETPKQVFMFLDLIRGGDLFDLIESKRRIPEDDARWFFFQALQAVQYLHKHRIAHRDIKNFPRLLLTDFGMARHVGANQAMGTLCGTWLYCAPEIVSADPYSRSHTDIGYGMAVDCWSLGVLLYVMLSGTLPFYTESAAKGVQDGDERLSATELAKAERDADRRLFAKIAQGKLCFPHSHWAEVTEEAITLIRHLLAVNPLFRYTVDEALAHPWISRHMHRLSGQYRQIICDQQNQLSDVHGARNAMLAALKGKDLGRSIEDGRVVPGSAY